jgi:signal transduction histidine kinase
MFKMAEGEKKLMALINATISHEMRNPINSIRSQNLLQQQLNQKLDEILKNPKIKSIDILKSLIFKILL